MKEFYKLDIGDEFYFQGSRYIKIAEAIPRLRLDRQPPNCINLENKHRCTFGYKVLVG